MYGGRTLLSVHDNTWPVNEGTSYNCRYKGRPVQACAGCVASGSTHTMYTCIQVYLSVVFGVFGGFITPAFSFILS